MIIGDTFLNDGCLFNGNVQRINTPLLPHGIANTIIALINPEDKKKKEKVFSDGLDKLKGKKILVVDDNTINLKFMKEVLKKMNMETVLAQSGDESIEKFKTEEIDLIFMDENMPGMNGGEAISIIRKREEKKKLKKITIIGLTGDADEKTRESLLNAGADDVLTKPVQLKEIIRVISEYV
jgi:CheY-like chemotaxis protein